MVGPRLLNRSKKSGGGVPDTDASWAHQATAPENPNADPRTFSYADVSVLAERLIEQSRRSKSGFFKAERPRRAIRLSRAHSVESLFDTGVQAPSNTPDMPFLSRYASTATTDSGRLSCVGPAPKMTGGSVAETWSTVANTEPVVSREFSRTPQETAHGGSTNTKDSVLETDITPTISENAKDLPRNKSFSFQPARWGRNVIQDIKGPLRRYKIRQGKQPMIEDDQEDPHRQTKVMRRPLRLPKHVLEIELSQPSSSQHLDCLNLKGGDGPPKYRSERTLNRLDELDRELTRLHKQKVLVEIEKEELLSRVDESDDEQGIFIKGKKKKNGKITAFKPKVEIC